MTDREKRFLKLRLWLCSKPKQYVKAAALGAGGKFVYSWITTEDLVSYLQPEALQTIIPLTVPLTFRPGIFETGRGVLNREAVIEDFETGCLETREDFPTGPIYTGGGMYPP